MPEQTILDLPVIQFELYEDSPGRLHALCIESYGLAGFRPHPDAVFHFSASLWRYRGEESLKQITLLSGCYLGALSRHVAARRRVAAVRAALEEAPQSGLRARLGDADDELALAQEDLADISGQLSEFVTLSSESHARDPVGARARVQRNLKQMGSAGWTDRLEHLARTAARCDEPRVNWSAPLKEILDDLEAVELPFPSDVQGRNIDGALLNRLQDELSEYRGVADRASRRLQEVDSERHELERLLQDTEQGFTDRSIALEEARHALEVTLADARERISRMERAGQGELENARREIAALRSERDRLAAELVAALDAATDNDASSEDLIVEIERAASDRLEAAEALSSLSRRLEEIQNEAEIAAERSDGMHLRVRELEETVEALTDELSRSEERHLQALATIEALEDDAGRNSEFESVLTASEERLADTEERLSEAEQRVDSLAGQLEDKDFELLRTRERAEAQKRTIDAVSVQLAEAETLTDEHEARIVGLERENERLRRDLSDAQSRMLDARGDVDEARDSAESARVELERLKQRLNEERGKSSEITHESVELRRALRDRDDEIARLKVELEDVQARLKHAGQSGEDQGRRIRDLQDEIDNATAIANDAQSVTERLRGELKTALDAGAASRAEAERLTRESATLREESQRAKAELEALRNSANAGGGQLAQLRAGAVEWEQQVAALQAELAAAGDLAEDRRAKLEERLELARARTDSVHKENETLLEALEQAEKSRKSERRDYEALIERERHRAAGLDAASGETQELRDKLNESEAFLIKRQREFERTEHQLKGLLEEVRGIADLRAKYEKAKPGKKQDAIASQIGRRMDSLFSAAGKPVNADRRTEKLVILTVKKTEEEIAAESEKPFVATKKEEDSNDDGSFE
ncbi:MAG: hypothetical protein K8I27_09815 [Planctomycetes bacterium]|nr:hypothetical protein [Planctomycetota bacterium]